VGEGGEEAGRQGQSIATRPPLIHNSLSGLLNKPIPEKLWHYTSIQGFHGIVTSKRIFATDVRFLNDSTELIHAREIAHQLVAETDEFAANLFPARNYSKKAFELAFESGPLSADRLQVFVASFSEAEDQLSQWCGYSQGTSGVSVAFNLGAFRPSPSFQPADVGLQDLLASAFTPALLRCTSCSGFGEFHRRRFYFALRNTISGSSSHPPCWPALPFATEFVFRSQLQPGKSDLPTV
jgi:hypothetical protein